MTRKKVRRYGYTSHAGGRSIDIISDHSEWTSWAIKALNAAAAAERDAFILVEVAKDNDWSWPKWRATRVTEQSTIDLWFFALNVDAAREHVRVRYPNATFSDQVRS